MAAFDPPFGVAAAAPFPLDPLGVDAGVASLPEPPLRALTSLNTPGGRPPVPAAGVPLPPPLFPFADDDGVALEAPDPVPPEAAAVSPAATLRDLAGGEEIEGELPPAPFLDAEAPPPPLPDGGRPRRFSPESAIER